VADVSSAITDAQTSFSHDLGWNLHEHAHQQLPRRRDSWTDPARGQRGRGRIRTRL